MKIIQLTAENIKRLRAVTIKPDGSLVQITGRNGQGKSSVLDAITYALGGKDVICDKPVREGESRGVVVCQLDGLTVKRTFTAAGGGSLTVTSPEGAAYASPQAMLDKLVGKLTFDPLAFAKMAPKQHREALTALVGLDLSALEGKRTELYADRTDLNRRIKAMEVRLEGMQQHADLPAEVPSISALMERHAEASHQLRENDKVRRKLEDARASVARYRTLVNELLAKLEEAENLLGKAKDAVSTAEVDVARLNDPDLDSLRAQIVSAEGIGQKLKENEYRADIARELEDLKRDSQAITEEMTAIEQRKAQAIEQAKFPVPGLSFDAGGVIYEGIPFCQCSSAEQLRVSVAMGLAMNPKLRVLLIRDGSLLDSEGLKMVAEMAAKADAQVWIERVSDGDPVGVVIEDGQVSNQE